MNNRKNYNSILFLTVYLGLVLVGGSAQVLANAATPRLFDVKTEIEYKDDFDTKPDDDQAFDEYAVVLQDLYGFAKDFSEKNKDQLRDRDYEFDCAVTLKSDASQTFNCRGGSGLFWGGFLPSLEKIGRAFPHVDGDGEQFRVNLILSETDFFLKTSLTQNSFEETERFSKNYNDALSRLVIQRIADARVAVYQNTEISFDDDQVFIVTRLARASIDSLLAEDAQ